MDTMSNAGRFNFSDGGSYTGSWYDGVVEGLGVYSTPYDRNEFQGSWRGGFEESGVYRWSRGNYYEGQWLQGKRHGLGVERHNGWLYKGEWTQGSKGRYGLRQSTKSGAKYEGSWTFGLQDGYGVETYADGGTFHGQWLHGMRHGYGVRMSVSYDLALRYHQTGATPSAVTPEDNVPTRNGHDTPLVARDRQMEEGRAGGFVLEAQTPQRRSRSTIRGVMKLIRQRSLGNAEERGRVTTRAPGGSVRSTISTGRKSPPRGIEENDQWGSFTSIVDASLQADLVERYWGEWKNDRRSGYGICERSDGVKYEGEWLDNRRNGYGVTTLRDGTRIEGKYKRNVLLTSTKDAKLFLIRTGRLKEMVEAAVKEAEKAAKAAKEKEEIADARMASARVKADQAQMEAERAETLAEAAIAQAQKCSTNVAQTGVQLYMNQAREEEFLSPGAEGEATINRLDPKTQRSSKFLSLLRSKKHPSIHKAPALDLDSSLSQGHNTAKFYSAAGNSSGNSIAHNSSGEFKGHQPRFWPEKAFAQSTSGGTRSTGSEKQYGDSLHAMTLGFGAQRSRLPHQMLEKPEVPVSRPEAALSDVMQRRDVVGKQEALHDVSLFSRASVVSSSPVAPAETGNLSTFARTLNHHAPEIGHQTWTPGRGRRRAQAQIDTAPYLPDLSPADSSGDNYSSGANLTYSPERRKSLPSIIKETEALQATKPEIKNTKAEIKPGSTATVPVKETFVIEDGIRKRVTPIYGPRSPVRALAVEGRSGLPKLYQIESSVQGRERGSVPDVSTARNIEVLPRDVAYVLSQQRREELARERAATERRGSQIILRLGDVTDWCARRKMLIVVLAVNYALITVFYNMLQQQNH